MYRESAKPNSEEKKKTEKIPFEVRLCLFRRKIPGPIRRLLGALFLVPVFVISAILAVVVLMPIAWILADKEGVDLVLERSCWINDYRPLNLSFRSECLPLVRGTYYLFFDVGNINYLLGNRFDLK
jgi:hypothetical protein